VGDLDVVVWWEKRRFPYNVVIGTVGLISLVIYYFLLETSGYLKPGEDAIEPFALILAPILINICYTGGWIAELVLRLFGLKEKRIATVLLGIGMVVSLLCALAPALMWTVLRLLMVFGVKF
jgi:hypothetical protein